MVAQELIKPSSTPSPLFRWYLLICTKDKDFLKKRKYSIIYYRDSFFFFFIELN